MSVKRILTRVPYHLRFDQTRYPFRRFMHNMDLKDRMYLHQSPIILFTGSSNLKLKFHTRPTIKYNLLYSSNNIKYVMYRLPIGLK